MHTLDATPEVVLDHQAGQHEAHIEKKKARSHKYVLSSSNGPTASTIESHYPRPSSPSTMAWVLNLLLCHRHSKSKSKSEMGIRHHNKDTHSLAATTDKTHAVSVYS